MIYLIKKKIKLSQILKYYKLNSIIICIILLENKIKFTTGHLYQKFWFLKNILR